MLAIPVAVILIVFYAGFVGYHSWAMDYHGTPLHKNRLEMAVLVIGAILLAFGAVLSIFTHTNSLLVLGLYILAFLGVLWAQLRHGRREFRPR